MNNYKEIVRLFYERFGGDAKYYNVYEYSSEFGCNVVAGIKYEYQWETRDICWLQGEAKSYYDDVNVADGWAVIQFKVGYVICKYCKEYKEVNMHLANGLRCPDCIRKLSEYEYLVVKLFDPETVLREEKVKLVKRNGKYVGIRYYGSFTSKLLGKIAEAGYELDTGCVILFKEPHYTCPNCGLIASESGSQLSGICNICDSEGVWMDPVGGVHSKDGDPAKMYE